jgi:copper transport protein
MNCSNSTGATLATAAAISPEVRIARTALLAGLAVLVAPAVALAHASLVRTSPADGAVLARSPASIRLTFDDTIRAGPGIAAIRNGAGSVLRGAAHIALGKTLVVPLERHLPDGDYSVRWAIVSDDGHLESGVLVFGVGLGRAPPAAALTAEATGPTFDSAGARWLFFAGVLGAAGIALFTFVVRPRDLERIPIVVSTAGVLAALGAAQEIHRVGLSTRDGTVLGVAFVIALVVATLGAAAMLERGLLRPALFVSLLLALVPSFAGHALDHGLSRVNVVADVLHVVSAAGWIGVLVGLVVTREVNLRRVTVLALASVALLGVTGITRAVYELTGLSQLWATSYGRALLVKTGLLLGALVLGRLLRRRVRVRAGIELVLVAAVVAAVSVLVELRPGRNVVSPLQGAALASQPSAPPPPPPRGAIVVAQESGPLGVAIEAEPQRITAIVLSPAGGGLSGLRISIDGQVADACGSGCYSVEKAPGRSVAVQIGSLGPAETLRFALPAEAPDAATLVRNAGVVFRTLNTVTYRERLASDATHVLVAHWQLQRPDGVEYSIAGGAQGIVLGDRRWDRATPNGTWVESQQTLLHQPATQWAFVANAHVIAQTPKTITVSFADPTIPAFFTVAFERYSLRPRVLHMTAASHFMTDTYLAFNGARAIRPPR